MTLVCVVVCDVFWCCVVVVDVGYKDIPVPVHPGPLWWVVGYLCVVGKKFVVVVVVVVVGFCFALLKSCKDARPMVVPLIVFQQAPTLFRNC